MFLNYVNLDDILGVVSHVERCKTNMCHGATCTSTIVHHFERRFILDYVFWTNFFHGSVYFRLVKTMYFGLSPGHVVFYTSLKVCTLAQTIQRLDFTLTIISFPVFYTNDQLYILAQKILLAYFRLMGYLAFQPNNQCKIHHLPLNHAFYAMYFELCIFDFEKPCTLP